MDERGDTNSRLDIVSTRFRGLGDGEATITVRTKRPWPCTYLNNEPAGGYEDGDGAFLYWEFDLNPRNPHMNAVGHFRCRQGDLELVMVRSRRTFPAIRPDRRTATATIPLRKMDLDRPTLRLRAMSQVNGYSDGHVLVEEQDVTRFLHPGRQA